MYPPYEASLPTDVKKIPYKNLDGRVQRVIESINPDHHGGFSDVYIGYFTDDRNSRIKVAIKILRMTRDADKVENVTKYLIRETVVWQDLKHRNVLPFFGLAHDLGRFGCPALIAPYCERGTVTDYLQSHSDIDTRLFIIKGVSEGVRYLHKQGIVHGDIKPSNILIHEDGYPLLCDFGRSKILTQRGFTTKPAGACRYQAPELLQGTGPNKSTDIYAFALSSYEIWTGQQPFHTIHQDTSIIISIIMRDARPEPPDPAPLGTEALWEIFENCWRTDPEERLEIEEIIQELAGVSLPT